MLRTIPDLPSGVIGIEAVGEVHADDYRDVLRPAIDQAVARGQVRLVYVLGEEFTGYSAGAVGQDLELGFDHMSGWVRTAVVSDVEWIVHLAAAFGWLVPGELRRFPLDRRAEAVRWAAGEDDPTEPWESEPPVQGTAPAPTEAVVEPPADAGGTAATTETQETVAAPVDATIAVPVAQLPQSQTLTPTAPLNPDAGVRAGFVAASAPMQPSVPAQWATDPAGRHQHRWWDGARWTEHVADNGVASVDPLG